MSSPNDKHRLSIIAVLHGSTEEAHHESLHHFIEKNSHDPHKAFNASMSLYPIISLITKNIDAIDTQRHYPICVVLESFISLFDSIRARLWDLDLSDATRWLQFIANINECHHKIIEYHFPSVDLNPRVNEVSGGVQIFTLRRHSPLSCDTQEESVGEKVPVESEGGTSTHFPASAISFETHLQLEAPSQVDIGVRQLMPVKHPTSSFISHHFYITHLSLIRLNKFFLT